MKACPQCGKTFDDDATVCTNDSSTLTQLNTSDGDPFVGKLLDEKYRLLQKIGQGGMGSIYRAVHIEMGRTCAIKLLTAVSPGNEDALARFKREAKMASRIDNPHAVTIYDFGESEDGTMFLAMEFIDGKPLSKVIATERPIPAERVVRITSQIAEGLAAAHAMEIVHRDLKPDNVMITRKGAETDYVKVLDFGIAKTVAEDGGDHLTKTGFVLGTPVYMSPEQLLGEKLDPRSDIYSLAIIVYEMLSGRLPFEGENPQSVMMKRILAEPIRLRTLAPRVSESLEQAVMEGLQREREARTPTVQAFASALRYALMGQTQVMGGRVTGRIDDGGTQRWSVLQTRPETGGGTEYAHSVSPGTAARTPAEPGSKSTIGGPAPHLDSRPEGHTVPETAAQPPDLRTRPDPRPSPPVSQGSHEVYVEPATPSASRKWLLAVALLVLLGIALTLYLIWPFGASKVTLAVQGAPADAAVFINDEQRGTTAQDGTLNLSDVEVGSKLTIKRDGFSTFWAAVDGKPGEARSIKAAMLPLAIKFGGSDLVLVEAGKFEMGDDDHEADERPKHTVDLPAFYIDKYEVTNKQYKAFCDKEHHRYPPKPTWDPDYFDRPDYPVLGIEFDDALYFAGWTGKRLPTEEEWEKAAGWDPDTNTKREYPWGNSAISDAANVGRQPARVGQYSKDKSAYGVYDMAGNAAEWVDAFYAPYTGGDPSIFARENKGEGVTRGAMIVPDRAPSTISDPARVSRRNRLPRVFPPNVSIAVGIRCAISADDPRIQPAIAARMK